MAKNEVNPFQGLWIIVHSHIKDQNGDWVLYERFRRGEASWTFTPAPDRSDGLVYGGWLREHLKGRKDDFVTEYSFYVEDRELSIDKSVYCDDGFSEVYDEDLYRVRAEKDRLILDHIEHPNECRYRLTLKRNNLKNRLIGSILAPKIRS